MVRTVSPLFVFVCFLFGLVWACADGGDRIDELEVPELDATDPVEYVNPFIGTGGHYFGYGSTFAGACLPHGLAKPGPDTTTPTGAAEFHHFSGYHHDDDMVLGFSNFHISGTGASDYGTFMLMPTSGFDENRATESGLLSVVDKASEQAEPGYYSIRTIDHDIFVELTATEHVAMHRYTFPTDEPAPTVVLDVSHGIVGNEVTEASIEVTADGAEFSGGLLYHGSLTGRSGGVRLFFCARPSVPPTSWTLWQDGQFLDGALEAMGSDVGAGVLFAEAGAVTWRIGVSAVDVAGARNNLDEEVGEQGFDAIREQASQVWSESLSKVRVAGGSQDERIMFYTALYHSKLTPTLFSDVDGRYMGFDKQVHVAEGFRYYTDFSIWDTYRTAHPLFILTDPGRQRDMLHSLLAMKEQGGYLPKWPAGTGYTGCMIGTPADLVFAGSYLKGITDFDVEVAFAAVVENATTAQPKSGRDNVESYMSLGYVASDVQDGSVARTMEFAAADGAIAEWATALGRSTEAQAFAQRAENYKLLYDEETGFFRGRNTDGAWNEPASEFKELNWDHPNYTEGTAWQYLWLAPQDAAGLIELMGGSESFLNKLEAFFSTPEPEDPLNEFLPKRYYWHGNEPDIHAAYLFNDAGRPDRAQHWLRHIIETRYGTGPDGLPGNDDCGTLSAWYVFSASGFYPNAGHSQYWIGSPLFERVVFSLAGDVEFEIRSLGADEETLYVHGATLDGQALAAPFFDHAQIAAGGLMEFSMSTEPSATWNLPSE